ncbi:endopeptidase La [bacterium]|nr:endopeptidase La [bacterium]
MSFNNFFQTEIPNNLPLFILNEGVLFPLMMIGITPNKSDGLAKLLGAAEKTGNYIVVVAEKNAGADMVYSPDASKIEKIYNVGTLAAVIRDEQGEGKVKGGILLKGLKKVLIKSVHYNTQFNGGIATVEIVEENNYLEEKDLPLLRSAVSEVRNLFKTMSSMNMFPPAVVKESQNIGDPARFAEFVASNLLRSTPELQKMLEENSPLKKILMAKKALEDALAFVQVQNDIKRKTMERLDKGQKDMILREQIKQIQNELGEGDPFSASIRDYEKKLEHGLLPDHAVPEVKKQIERLKSMSPFSQDSSMLSSWIDSVFDLPWKDSTEDNKDINEAEKVLQADHYGLEDVKERILEFLAVRQIKGDQNSKSPILCFVGPPGVGKTSLGKSIARALKRKFYRLSLGGLHDEAEIRGHRRTYVGAMQGKILKGLTTCKSNNPVFMLDEIDKLGKDFRGDPSSALLEVLDPEQNFSFLDNYIGLPFDLSKVFFIATANWEDTIPEPLKDRMEIIHLSGYTDLERIEIAKKYLIPRQLENNGLSPKEIQFTKEALLFISRRYTREAGVRNLERCIGSICRKTVTLKVQKKDFAKKITPKVVEQYLKLPPFSEHDFDEEKRVGVITGLAWTQYGGATLKIEANSMKGSGNLLLTGKLGEVMQESARIALSFIRSNAAKFGLGADFTISDKDIHIHFPAGATPKDGPSAGIAITSALLSLFLNKAIDPKTAMTGEISLTGEVLPIGGLKEKLLAAKRNEVNKVFIPERNRALYESIEDEIKSGIDVVFVKEYSDVFKVLFG